jgi:hypothetical protein
VEVNNTKGVSKRSLIPLCYIGHRDKDLLQNQPCPIRCLETLLLESTGWTLTKLMEEKKKKTPKYAEIALMPVFALDGRVVSSATHNEHLKEVIMYCLGSLRIAGMSCCHSR